MTFKSKFREKVQPKHGFKKSLTSFYKRETPKQFSFTPRYYIEPEDKPTKLNQNESVENIKAFYDRRKSKKSAGLNYRLIIIIAALGYAAWKFLI